ncbi:hypothetical protein PF005_g9561 [Phytophthora fragariae]|uniref:Uncharacterized protein n=1 Tax=Phytophthora fragariae TaxID=53985 RepID=A0A6A3YAY7_9STRA|nr:hypothetical protein PF005_g9561 [Phytophthora fragariae]
MLDNQFGSRYDDADIAKQTEKLLGKEVPLPKLVDQKKESACWKSEVTLRFPTFKLDAITYGGERYDSALGMKYHTWYDTRRVMAFTAMALSLDMNLRYLFKIATGSNACGGYNYGPRREDREQFDYGGHLRPPPDYVQQRGYEGRAEPPRHIEERGRLSMRAGYEQARDEAYRRLGCRPPSPPCRDFGPRGSSPPRAPLSRLGLRSSRGNSGRLVGVMIINGTLVRHHGVVALHLTTMIGTSTAPVEVDQEW